MRDYFKNGEGINFLFPIDGDCVNEYDGFVKDGVLYVYYGCADKYVSLATANFDELVNYLWTECKE